MENFKWCINWITTKTGGSGTHFSYLSTLEEAINECKQEHMYNHYTGEIIRPDLKITTVWKFVQYGENKEEIAMEENNMKVCEHCLWAIQSREGNQVTRKIYIDADDYEHSKCDWCEEYGFSELYELI